MTWLDDLEERAPDVVATYRNVEAGKFITVRREVRRRTGLGSAPAIVPQLDAIADALTAMVDGLPDAAFSAPGGEGDWNVAQAIGHDILDRGIGGALYSPSSYLMKTPPQQCTDHEARRRIDAFIRGEVRS